MVSQKKVQAVQQVAALLGEYPVVGLLNMHKLPGRQLHEIRNKLRGQAVIRMAKKRLLLLALKEKGLEKLEPYIQGEPALFLTKENPFRIARVLMASKSEAAAKEGDVAPRDIVVKAGPTSLTPGPVIGELQKVKIPAGVEGDKIVIKRDAVIAKQGDVITKDVAAVLSKLDIKPMEIGLNLVAALEQGVVYEQAVLFIPADHYLNELKAAASRAFALSMGINFITKETLPTMLGKARREAQALAVAANIVSPDTIGSILAGADAAAQAVQAKLPSS
ncbi:MAG: 50S ribosomal protein L10 [Candidatus Aenigmarchaeota archaeon]|nr:50S ribosomal protein L10 [Candidatus Aenigmarchaeota archaeon]